MAWEACVDFPDLEPAGQIPARRFDFPENLFLLRILEAITLDTARRNSNDAIGNDSSPLVAKNSLVWGVFLVGVVIGFMAVYLVVAQPLFAQLVEMRRQMASLETDMQSLVGARNQAW